MTNLEFYKEKIREEYNNDIKYKGVSCEESMTNALYTIKAKYDSHGKSLLDWLCEEHQILDKEEKEYLGNIIKPFRDQVLYIYKYELSAGGDRMLINFAPKYGEMGHFVLPGIKKGTMYKNMAYDKKYTLKELGL